MIRLFVRSPISSARLCNYHRTASCLTRGNVGSPNPESQAPALNFQRIDILPKRKRIPEEVTLDEYKSIIGNDVITDPLQEADPEFIDEMGPQIPTSFNIGILC